MNATNVREAAPHGVATLRVTSQTNTVNEVPLYAAEDVERGGMMRRGIDSLAHLAFGWVL